jgi:hypothetical protein
MLAHGKLYYSCLCLIGNVQGGLSAKVQAGESHEPVLFE